MSEEIMDVEAEVVESIYPIPVTLSFGAVQILDPEGEPSGERLMMPDGSVTALFNDGGAMNEFSEQDLLALAAVVAEIPFL